MNNKILLFLIPLFLINFISADISLNPFATKITDISSPTSDTSDFLKTNFNTDYGIIKLSLTVFWIPTDKLAEYSLTDNTRYCLNSCSAQGKVTLYQDGSLFENINFYDIKKGMNLRELEYKIYIGKSYNKLGEPIWEDYNYETLIAGNYEWKIEGTKGRYESIDWIATSFGKDLTEWAAWDTYTWYPNLTINASLPDIGDYATPSVFQKDGTWYLISGNSLGTFNGYALASNGTTWLINLTINSSLPSIGTRSSPSVFYMPSYSSWFLISGNGIGTFNGYAWNGTDWLTNLTINSSLPATLTFTSPNVFYKDSSWYLISGNQFGNFYGYAWNGTTWLKNLTINASLFGIGSWSKPLVFQKDGTWYLISGELAGEFFGFVYNGTNWSLNSTINSSLPDVGAYSSPSVFQMGSDWYLIGGNGNTGGKFFGYAWNIDITPPTYISNSAFPTAHGIPTNFSITVNDVELIPDGQYIFSTNNTGEWANDSSINFTSDFSQTISTVKVFNNTMPYVGYRWYLKDNNQNSISTPIYVGEGIAKSWVVNTTINASLPDIGSWSAPSVFQKDGTWYLISGNSLGTFAGYALASNGTTWLKNLTINASLVDVGTGSNPTVFNMDGNWYLIVGNNAGALFGFVYNGTNWSLNSSVNASLPVITGGYLTPNVFQKDGTWYLISGNNDGRFYGYAWNGTDWLKNLTINSSLPDIGIRSSPSVFYKDSSWFLISGSDVGRFYGYVWNGTDWKVNLTINSSLPAIGGGQSTPSIFYKDSSWYLIAGEIAGSFYGYNYFDWNSPTYSQVSSNNTKVNEITLFSVNISDEGLSPNGGYIFSTNNTGIWINDTLINFTSTPSWANVTKILNSTHGTEVGYMWYFNDTNGNRNSTIIYELTAILETNPPNWTVIPNNETINWGIDWAGVTFTAIDDSSIYGYYVNDSRFSMNSTGFLDNASGLSAGVYTLNITVNDTAGNINITLYKLTVSQVIIDLTLTSSKGWNIIASQYTTITGAGCPNGCTLYQAGTLISNPFTNIFPAGAYQFIYNLSGNENYTSDSITNNLYSQVNQSTINGTIGNGTTGTIGDLCIKHRAGYNYLNNQKWVSC